MTTAPKIAIALTADPAAVRTALEQASQDVRRFASSAQSQMASTGAAISTSLNGSAIKQATLNFKELRGGMIAMTQAAVGQAVPGLGQLAGVLGTFAIGAGPMVAVLGGIALLALRWKEVTKEAREAKQAHQELVGQLESKAKEMFTDPRVGIRGEMGTRRARMAEIQEEIAQLPKFRYVPDAAGAKTGGSTRVAIPVEERVQAVTTLMREFTRHAQVVAAATQTIKELDAKIKPITQTISSAGGAVFRGMPSGPAAALAAIGGVTAGPRTAGESLSAWAHRMRKEHPTTPEAPPSTLQQLGGAAGITSTFLSPFASQGGALGMLAQGGMAFAGGGPAGLAGFGINAVGGLLSRWLGSSQEREEEAYRAHVRALREAREENRQVVNVFVAGLPDPRSGQSREWFVNVLKEAGVTRTGGFNLRQFTG